VEAAASALEVFAVTTTLLIVVTELTAFKFLLLPAFTTGRSKKVARRHTMDIGKYTFLTLLGFSWLLERH
jgi:hypothetical protein